MHPLRIQILVVMGVRSFRKSGLLCSFHQNLVPFSGSNHDFFRLSYTGLQVPFCYIFHGRSVRHYTRTRVLNQYGFSTMGRIDPPNIKK